MEAFRVRLGIVSLIAAVAILSFLSTKRIAYYSKQAE